MRNGLGAWLGAYQPDTTREADKQAGAFDDPQVLIPGLHGSVTPAALRSNRGDGYSRLMVQMANAISFPPGISSLVSDVLLWIATSGAIHLAVKLGTPLMPFWFPWVTLGLAILVIFIPSLTVCLHRKELLPFLVLRLILIGIGITIVY